jgi:RNA polymerase sigma factor (sigma-70 family)
MVSAAESPATDAARRVDALYRDHASEVYRYAFAVLGNRADAEDVTQTTFVNALRALERGESPRKPANWLIVIAHNLVRQRWRHAASRPAEVELVGDVAATAPSDEQTRLDDLVTALQRIPPTQREALVMRELEGRSYAEIAELLGLSTSALETLLFRARRSLADELENLVTCERAELDLTRRLDGRLGRKQRRRLEEHLASCPACAARAATYAKQRRAFTGLALLPLPLGATFSHGAPAGAVSGLATIGVAATATNAVGIGAGAGAGAGGAVVATATGATGAGLLTGTVAKVAAVVVAGTIATGAGVKGAELARDGGGNGNPARPAAVEPKATASQSGRSAGSGATRQRGVTPTSRAGRGDERRQSAPATGRATQGDRPRGAGSRSRTVTGATATATKLRPERTAKTSAERTTERTGEPKDRAAKTSSTTPKTTSKSSASGETRGRAVVSEPEPAAEESAALEPATEDASGQPSAPGSAGRSQKTRD